MLTFNIDLSGIARLRRKLTENPHAMAEIRGAWALIYRAFLRNRFAKASRNDGTWPPLAPSTIRQRRGHSDQILRDTGKLFASFQPTLGTGGALQTIDKPLGIEVVLGGSPMATLAMWHQQGDPARNRPPRELLVAPDESAKQKMAKVAREILIKAANE